MLWSLTMFKVLTPETKPIPTLNLFLAGSIENGVAVDWQTKVIKKLHETFDKGHCDVNVFNPRRADWDSSIDSTSDNDELVFQIRWELDALEKSDVIVMYFDPNTKSPISLMELGLHKDKNIFVFCPKEFWRSANVRVTCEEYGIPLYEDYDDWISDITLNSVEHLVRRGF